MELLQELDVVPAPNAVRGRGPLADTVHGEHGGLQAVFGGTRRERRVPLLTAETLLLCSRDNLPVPQQAGGAVVVECGDTQDVGVRHVIELGRAVVSGSTQRMQDLGCEQASQRVALTASAPASCATIIRATAARLLPTAVWRRCNRNGDRSSSVTV